MDCVNWKCSRQNKADAQKFVTNQRILLVVKQDIGGCDKKRQIKLIHTEEWYIYKWVW